MINHIAYLSCFNDKNKLSKDLNFNKFIFKYEKDKFLNLIDSSRENNIFFISDSFVEFRTLFFKMGLIYKIFKKYNFEAEIEINKKVYKTKTFSDYYDLFENCTSGYININFPETKFSITFIDYKMEKSYVELLSNFFKFSFVGNMIGISFIYSLDSSRTSFDKIVEFNKNLIKKGNNKKWEGLTYDILSKPLLKNNDKKNIKPPIDSKSAKKKFNKPPPIKSKFLIKYPISPPPIKLPPIPKKRKSITKKPIIKTINITKQSNKNSDNKVLKDKTINRKGNFKIIEDMFSVLSLINKSKSSNFKFEDFLNNLDEVDNQKLITINNRLHKKVINNFHKIKLNQDRKDKEITRKIIRETMQVLNECLIDLSLLES